MARKPKGRDELSETVFDITKSENGIEFLGLLDSPKALDNKLTGVFDWTCPACDTSNRDAVAIEAQQPFLGNWSCTSCSKPYIVRFRARASVEWIAGHTLAVTGSALCNLVGNDLQLDHLNAEARLRRAGSQRAFAWISIPVLVAIILFGLSGMRPAPNSSAALSRQEPPPPPPTAVSRLLGSWVGQDAGDQLYFGRIDPVTRTGRHIHFPQARPPGHRGWFSVVHEDVKGEQLVIRVGSERSDGQNVNDPSELPVSEVMIYVPMWGRLMTWVGIEAGVPVVKTYRRANGADILSR